jgi:hypothetical protein
VGCAFATHPLSKERKHFFFEKKISFFQARTCFLERLHPDWKIIGIRRAAPASCLQSICISLKPPAHEGRFQSG